MNRSSKDHRESYLRRREVPEYRRNYSSAWCDPRNEMAATAETEAGPFQKKPPVSAPDVHAATGWAIEATYWHVVRFEEGMLTRPILSVKS